MVRLALGLLAVALCGTACTPRPPGSQVQRELAGVDDTERSAAGEPADDLAVAPSGTRMMRLTGIIKAGGKRRAMLEDEHGDGLVVQRGDFVGEFRVDAIGKDHVELSRPRGDGGRERLRLVIE